MVHQSSTYHLVLHTAILAQILARRVEPHTTPYRIFDERVSPVVHPYRDLPSSRYGGPVPTPFFRFLGMVRNAIRLERDDLQTHRTDAMLRE